MSSDDELFVKLARYVDRRVELANVCLGDLLDSRFRLCRADLMRTVRGQIERDVRAELKLAAAKAGSRARAPHGGNS